ncbi:MAG: TonB-dependent receptor [Pseudomonadota bacterium]
MIRNFARSLKGALLVGSGAIALCGGATAASAQDANENSQTGIIEEPVDDADDSVIIVTGQKITRSLQDTNASVAVTDAATIQEANFRDIFDVIGQTANVTSLFDGAGFAIRGIRNTGAGSGESTSDVASIFVDGVFIPSSLLANGAFSVWDAQSVEIFRGPQSTIQGRNSLAGAVVVRTVDPGSDFSGDFQFEASEFNTYRGSAALTVPIAPGQVGLRLAGDYSRSDGFQTNTFLNRDDIDQSEAITARATLLITPDFAPDLSVRITGTYSDKEEGENRVVEAFFPERRVSIQDLVDRQGAEAYIASGEINYEVTDELTFTSTTAYIESESFFNFDADSTNPVADPFTATPGGMAALQESLTEDRIFTQELRLTYESGSISGLLGGYFYDNVNAFNSDNSTVVGTDFAFPDPTTLAFLIFGNVDPVSVGQATFVRDAIVANIPSFPVQLVRSSTAEVQNYAVFGEATIDITERLRLTLGARYDSERVNQTVFDATIVPTLTIGDPLVDQVLAATTAQFSNAFNFDADNTFTAFLPKAGITYDVSDDASLAFTYQRAYRAGALSFNTFRASLAPVGSTQEDLEELGIVNSFDPEFTDNYEVAFRSVWADGDFVLNANAYYIDYTDQHVLLQLTPNPLDTITDNAGRSRLFGFEIESTIRPTDGLDLFINFGYANTEYTEAADVLGSDITGFRFPYTSPITVGFGGRYEHDSGFYLNMRSRFTDESFSSVNNVNQDADPIRTPVQDPSGFQDSLFTVDLNVGWESEYFGVEVFARNLLNERGLTFDPFNDLVNPSNPNSGFLPNDTTTAIANAPRVFGVRITAGF